MGRQSGASKTPDRKAPARAGGTGRGAGKKVTKRPAPARRRTARTRKKPQARQRTLLRRVLGWVSVLGIWGTVVVAVMVGYYALDLPTVGTLEQAARRPSLTFEAFDGTRLASYGDYYGDVLEVGDFSPFLPRAIVAIEDHRFYRHFGVDLLGLARAMWVNLRAGRLVQGGSTLTQQLAKNLFLTPERSLRRKIRELLLSLWLEQTFTKDEILSIYMNRVYLGAGAYGFDAAAQTYFGTSARNLTLSQAAVLAGLLKAPSRYSPSRSPALALARADRVLSAMAHEGLITAAQLKTARANPAVFKKRKSDQSLYFTDWARGRVEGMVGASAGDLVIRTTFDPRAQEIATRHLRTELADRGTKNRVEQGAVVVLAPDGAVQALVGGRDYRTSQYNRASQALRQPGSAFKVFVFLAGFEDGLRPETVMNDAPISIDGWSPRNYGNRYRGQVTLRDAFAYSSNSIAAQITQKVTPQRVADVAYRLGVDAVLNPSPALALGASEITLLDLTGAYAVLANGGWWVQPYGITRITDRAGRVLYDHRKDQGAAVVARDDHAMIDSILRDVTARGTGQAVDLPWPVAGKTGTTQSNRDALFVGYTPAHVVGIWYGNDDDSPMKGVTGGTLPARSWGRIVRDLQRDSH